MALIDLFKKNVFIVCLLIYCLFKNWAERLLLGKIETFWMLVTTYYSTTVRHTKLKMSVEIAEK